jgi:SAM-dependent methyltransferase
MIDGLSLRGASVGSSEPWDLEQLHRQSKLAFTHWWLVETKRLAAQALTRHLPPRARVLDAGSGVGALARLLGDSARVVAMDLSSAALALARQSANGRLVRSTVESLPFATGAFDGVASLDVLYHEAVTDDLRAIREMTRVLRPGGVLVMNLPAYAWMTSAHDRTARTSRRYTRRRVRALLVEGGLAPVRVTYWNAVLFPAAFVGRRLFPSRGSDLVPVHPALNSVLASILRAEAAWIRRAALPFGLSVFAIARRP